jgi:hypothetical protein
VKFGTAKAELAISVALDAVDPVALVNNLGTESLLMKMFGAILSTSGQILENDTLLIQHSEPSVNGGKSLVQFLPINQIFCSLFLEPPL